MESDAQLGNENLADMQEVGNIGFPQQDIDVTDDATGEILADINHNNQITNVLPRASARRSHPPVWMKDYVTHLTNSVHPHSLANYMSYSHLSGSYQTYLSTMSAEVEPKTYEEAIQDQRWVEAMKQEIAALEDNGTWTVVELPPGKKELDLSGYSRSSTNQLVKQTALKQYL